MTLIWVFTYLGDRFPQRNEPGPPSCMSGFVFHPGALTDLTEIVREHYDAG
jgi:hypothetical protein